MVLKNTTESNLDHAIAGAISGFATRFLCQPLDVIKIRFQLQVEPISMNKHIHNVNSKYKSLPQTVTLIIKEEGFSALWKGHVPAQFLSIVYGMVQFYSYNIFKKTLIQESIIKNDSMINFIAGASAGSIATIISFPFDTIRTRLVAQSEKHQVYKGVLHSFRLIFQQESPRVFFSGLLPTLLHIAPHTGLQFMFYTLFTNFYKQNTLNTNTTIYNSILSSSVSGLLAKTLVYPFDLTKKRMQIQGFQQGREGFGKFFHCNGFIDCLKMTIKKEKVKGLFKGLLPSQIKAMATTILHFTIYEQVLLLLKT